VIFTTKYQYNSKKKFQVKKGQKVAKWPKKIFEAKQEKKRPKSSYLASKRPKYQPC
jgi:hypothetical protein